jgi:hypothetical protein
MNQRLHAIELVKNIGSNELWKLPVSVSIREWNPKVVISQFAPFEGLVRSLRHATESLDALGSG